MKKKPTSKVNVYQNNYSHVTGLKFAGKGKFELTPIKRKLQKNDEPILKLEKQLRLLELENVRRDKKHKIMGKCDCCDQYTVLVKEIGMCGPCTFGESETLNGNW